MRRDMMRRMIAAFAAVVLNVSAATSQNDGVITVKVNKASKVLVERWIEGYKAVNPNVQIALVSGKNADADLTLVGAFANLDALSQRLREEGRDVVLLCSGWQNDFCLEDTLVAGALVERLSDCAVPHGDAAAMALALWRAASGDPAAYCRNATHVHRLSRLSLLWKDSSSLVVHQSGFPIRSQGRMI